MEHVSVWGSVSAVDHRLVAALELMPKGGEVIPLALSRYDTLKKKVETCGGVFGDQADHRAFFPRRMAEKKKKKKKRSKCSKFLWHCLALLCLGPLFYA